MKNETKSGGHAASNGSSHKAKGHESKGQEAKAAKSELARMLESIGQASKRLNDAASEATRRIESLEDELLAAEPGISVWGEPVLTQPASFTRADGTLGVGQRVITLGFDKVKKEKWGIAVREQLKSERDAVEEEVLLLRKADRELRLLALPHLEGLVRQILSTLEAQVRQVEVAEASAVSGVGPAADEAEVAVVAEASAGV